ncbi:MFS transporter [Alphaproteobacteria bacterium]|nr:MFS transporter [Alphaproteobacteria bacterium]
MALRTENGVEANKVAVSSSSPHREGFFSNIKAIPKGVFAVSLFGLFLGMSTTMVYSQIGMFMKTVLHADEQTIAMVDGIVEYIAFACRIFSGVLSDYLSDRKSILLAGCLLTLFARPILSIASSPLMVIMIQAIERLGNGFQATPRDSLIADLSPMENRGKSYGLSRSLKTTGALIGTPIAILIMYLSCNNYRIVFLCSAIPVALAILCVLKIKTPKGDIVDGKPRKKSTRFENPLQIKYLKTLDRSFWSVLLFAFIFELSHFSESLFPIYASQYLSKTWTGTESMCISIGQVIMSFPIGFLADKFGKARLIQICIACMILANMSLAFWHSIFGVYLGAFLWGGQMTAIQGLFLSLISERVDIHVRGTAIGVYYVTVGTAYFLASTIAGGIWSSHGGKWAYIYSLCIASFAFVIFRFLLPKKYDDRNSKMC